VLAERALEFVHADVLLGHVRLDDLAVMHEETGLSLDVFSKTTVATGKLGDQIIKDQQSRGGDGATGERGVGPVMAFCTEFEISRSSVRSKGVIWPTSRLPLMRIPTSTRR